MSDAVLNANDAVYFGFGEGGTVAHLARINLPALDVEPIAPTIFHAWERSAGSWTDAGAVQPAWLKVARAWRRDPGDAAPPVGAPGHEATKAGVSWAINFKVDTPEFAASNSFRIFLSANVTTSGDPIRYHVPDYPFPVTTVPGTPAPEESETDAWLEVSPLGSVCEGVTISASDIGTLNSASGLVNTEPDSVNVFFADPSEIPEPEDGRVLAKFRIAHFTQADDPLAPWSEIEGAHAVPSSSAGAHRHTFSCTPPPGGSCPELAEGELLRQCLLVMGDRLVTSLRGRERGTLGPSGSVATLIARSCSDGGDEEDSPLHLGEIDILAAHSQGEQHGERAT